VAAMSSSKSLVSAMDVVERAIADLVSTRHGQPSADDPPSPSPSAEEAAVADGLDVTASSDGPAPDAPGASKDVGVAEAAEPALTEEPEAPVLAEAVGVGTDRADKTGQDSGTAGLYAADINVMTRLEPATAQAAADPAGEPSIMSNGVIPPANAPAPGSASSPSRSYQRQPPARSPTDLSARLKARAMRAVLLALKEGHIPWDDVSAEHIRAYEMICHELSACVRAKDALNPRSF
jgi:hypothetical protein